MRRPGNPGNKRHPLWATGEAPKGAKYLSRVRKCLVKRKFSL